MRRKIRNKSPFPLKLDRLNQRTILVMGAPGSFAKFKRISRALAVSSEIDNICYLGNEFEETLSIRIRETWYFSGANTVDTILKFASSVPFYKRRELNIVVVTAWYHIPRCKLILQRLGFVLIEGIMSDWRIWRTDVSTIIKECVSFFRTYRNFRRKK